MVGIRVPLAMQHFAGKYNEKELGDGEVQDQPHRIGDKELHILAVGFGVFVRPERPVAVPDEAVGNRQTKGQRIPGEPGHPRHCGQHQHLLGQDEEQSLINHRAAGADDTKFNELAHPGALP